MLANVFRTAISSTKATYVAPSSALFARDILADIAVAELRAFKPAAAEVTDPVLLKKFTPPTPPPTAKATEVTKEELEAYAKGN
ncbi:hypothetical protein H9P43_002378 [Blastocladiella emersonii ATCC 22665]|nr:hypothetical protein H9P43_002378 [Blastocladiella emersonii ATCC 22665]